MRRFIVKASTNKRDSRIDLQWQNLLDDLSNDMEKSSKSPLTLRTPAGIDLDGYMYQVEDYLQVWREVSTGLRNKFMSIYDRDENEVSKGIDYEAFNRHVIDLAFRSNNGNDFMNKYKVYLSSLME